MPLTNPGNDPTSGHYQGVSQLFESEVAFKNYRNWIVKTIFRKYRKFGNKTSKPSVLEFGAGTGNLSEIARANFSVELKTLEIDEILIEKIISKRFENFKSIQEIKDQNLYFDMIFSSNVLEHIENDVEVLQELMEVLHPDRGILVLYVPAHQWLFSELDRSVGHYRRYSKASLKKKVEIAGLKVIDTHYADSIGVLATLAIKIFGYQKTLGVGSLGSMKFYDRFIHPFSAMMDNVGVKFLIGCNLILVATLEK
jgi:SAM-dependent methyltransferase